MCQGFSEISGFLHYFVFANLVTSSIWIDPSIPRALGRSGVGSITKNISLQISPFSYSLRANRMSFTIDILLRMSFDY